MTDSLHSNCDGLLQSLSDYLDGELSEEMCREILEHLETCGNCRAVLNTTRRTIDLVRLEPEAPALLPADVRARLFKRLDLDVLTKPPGA
jgi:anti-sigma factor (TIGR02949 family)